MYIYIADYTKYVACIDKAASLFLTVSSIVSVVFRWVGIIIHFASISREQMTSLRFIRFSHLGRRGFRSSAGGGAGGSEDSGASSSTSGSVISRTENQLLFSNGGARLTRCRIQNPLR